MRSRPAPTRPGARVRRLTYTDPSSGLELPARTGTTRATDAHEDHERRGVVDHGDGGSTRAEDAKRLWIELGLADRQRNEAESKPQRSRFM